MSLLCWQLNICLPCAGFAFSRDLRVNFVRHFYPPPHSPPIFYYPHEALHCLSVCVFLFTFLEKHWAYHVGAKFGVTVTDSGPYSRHSVSFVSLIQKYGFVLWLIALFNVLYFKNFFFFLNVFVYFRAKGQRGFANFQDSKYKELFATLLQGYRDKNVSLTAVKLIPSIMEE